MVNAQKNASTPITVGLNAAIIAVEGADVHVLTTSTAPRAPLALPYGPFDSMAHRSLDTSLKTWVQGQTGLTLGHVEQLYTFGNRFRSPDELAGGPRILSIGYLALVREAQHAPKPGSHWASVYKFLPWEDWRSGRPTLLDTAIRPALDGWIADSPPGQRPAQKDRVAIAFGTKETDFDPERALERIELMYEAGLLPEAHRDLENARRFNADLPIRRLHPDDTRLADTAKHLGTPMEADHRRILATALSRLRGKLKYRPVVFELLPESFTLRHMQHVVEALSGHTLHAQNFRRMVLNMGLVEETGGSESYARGRPAALYRFRPEVVRERRGAGLSGR